MKIEQFKELINKGISLDLIYLLQQIDKGMDMSIIQEMRIYNMMLSLERKGYINKTTITKEGAELLESLKGKTVKTKKFVKEDDSFEKWWKEYPGTTDFSHKGKSFVGGRAIRVRKEDCRVKFDKILKEGISIEEMLDALKYEVLQKKEESVKSLQNKLNYMQNSLTYLNQRTFEPFIELRKNYKTTSVVTNSVDI